MKRLIITLPLWLICNFVYSADVKPVIFTKLNHISRDTSIFSFNNYTGITDFSNIGLDSTAQYLFDNNPIFYNNWDNEKLFVYKSVDVEALPDLIELKLLQGDEKFTLTCHNGISSGYGYRWGAKHEGIDLPLRTGDSVMAAFDGVVRYARYSNSGYGNCIIIRHLNGLETLYGHLSSINVLENQFLKSGELIGLGGSTGRSTGPHLHFETRLNGHSFDPRLIINLQEKSLYSDSTSFPKTTLFGKSYGSYTPSKSKTVVFNNTTVSYNKNNLKTVTNKKKNSNYTKNNDVKNKKNKAVKKNESRKTVNKEVSKKKTVNSGKKNVSNKTNSKEVKKGKTVVADKKNNVNKKKEKASKTSKTKNTAQTSTKSKKRRS